MNFLNYSKIETFSQVTQKQNPNKIIAFEYLKANN